MNPTQGKLRNIRQQQERISKRRIMNYLHAYIQTYMVYTYVYGCMYTDMS